MDKKLKNISKKLTSATLILALVGGYVTPAHARILFVDDVFENDSETYQIGTDDDAASTNLTLEFGGTNSESIIWDTTQFNFSDDINVTGGVTASGTVTANGTLDANGVVTLGDNGDTVAIDSSSWDISSTGALSGLASLSGAGLSDCDTAGTSKLLWSSETNTFSCGTDQTGGGGTDLQGAYDADASGAHEILLSSGDGQAVEIRANANGDDLLQLQNSAAGNLINFQDLSGTTIDINSLIVDWDATGAFDLDSTTGVSIGAGAASDFTTTAGALTLNGAGGVNIVGNGSEIDITNSNLIDLNSADLTLDTATLSIDSTDTSNLTMSANNAADRTLTISASNAGAGNGLINVDSDIWDITGAGVASGLTGITSSGSVNFTTGVTISGGTADINVSSGANTTNIGTGTTTGTVTIGGTGTQTIAIGNGAGVKTVSLGSSNTTSTTTLLSGSGGLNLNVSNNQVTNIGTGTTTSQVSIGGGSNCVSVDSNTWDISCAGVGSGFTGFTSTGNINFTGATTFRIPQAASDPVTCSVGQEYYNTTTSTVRVCTTTNTWTSGTTTGTNYVFAYDTTTQTVAVANTFQDVTFSDTGTINGWTHTPGTAGFTAAVGGTYMVSVSARVAKSGGANTSLSVIGTLNNSQIAGSQAAGSAASSIGDSLATTYVITVTAGDVFNIEMTGGTSNVQILPEGSGTVRPSIQLNMIRIS